MAPIAIDRTFIELPVKGAYEPEALRLFQGSNGQLTWDQLLASPRVLIVSEAGMGKTVECKLQQERLWNDGEAAFFIELSALARSPLENQLLDTESERLEGWRKAQSERATFFLDSIDELKLTPASFEHAIRLFASALGLVNLHRARIVLTTRPIPLDRAIIEKYLDTVPDRDPVMGEAQFAQLAAGETSTQAPGDPDPPAWRYVALSPLTTAQMREIARQRDVKDIETLLDAIESQNAHEFTERPLDFLELCGDWNEHGRIRSHREQLVADIDTKLRRREDREERVSLSADKAREGAERLALAVLLSRRFTIWYGLDDDRAHGDGALDPRKVLTDWPEDEIKTLLERPLFGFATYGRMRFHHRSVIEFLAAERLRVLVDQGMSTRTLSRLLFTHTPVEVDVIKPAMRPVAAWLAVSLAAVRDQVLERDPSLLLRMGDPAAFTLDQRERALMLYVQRYGPGRWRGQNIPSLQIRRAADSALAPAVARAWAGGIENPEVRETLLQLIGAGAMRSCADIAYETAANATPELGPRLHGLRALADLGDPRLATLLDRMASDSLMWPSHLIATAIAHLFPRHMSLEQLLVGLGHLAGQKRVGGFAYMLPPAIADAGLPPRALKRLREGLVKLIEPSVAWDDAKWSLRTDRKDLIPALLATCRIELERSQATPEWAHAAALALRLAQRSSSNGGELRALAPALAGANAQIREQITWGMDRIIRSYERHPARPLGVDDRLSRLTDPSPVDFNWSSDGIWLTAALADRKRDKEDRALALALSQHVLGYDAAALPNLHILHAKVSDNPALCKSVDAVIEHIQNPPPEPSWRIENRKRTEQLRRKSARRQADWVQFWRSVMSDTDAAFAPENRRSTAINLWKVMRKAGHEGAGWNRGLIERAFNRDVADRLRDTLKHYWRNDYPSVRSERPPEERNSHLVIWTMGLAGVYAEAEAPGWATLLDAGEAELATRYALLDTQLPPWLEDVVEMHPAPVEALIGRELDGELKDVEQRHSSILQDLTRSTPEVRALFLPRVRAWVLAAWSTPPAKLAINDKLRVATYMLLAFGTETDRSGAKVVAARRLKGRPNQERVLFWLPILFELDPSVALDAMERMAAGVTPARFTNVTSWFAELFGHRARTEPGGLQALADRPRLLLRAARLSCRHIQYADDVEREGAFSPDARDDAEFARSTLINMLLNAHGTEAWHAKLEFAQDPEVASFRDRARALAEQALAEDWDAAPMDETEIVALERQREFAPSNRADMASLLRDRLDDIEDLLQRDVSPREAWATYVHERLLRRELARELEGMARTAYTVNQEAVTGDERESDIRLVSNRGALEAVIELKVAEQRYTVTDYEAALKTQLVKRYMAPEQRRVGCLVITLAKPRTWKHPKTGKILTPDALITHLNDVARSILPDLGNDAYLSVRLLDLRPRDLAIPSPMTKSATKKKAAPKSGLPRTVSR